MNRQGKRLDPLVYRKYSRQILKRSWTYLAFLPLYLGSFAIPRNPRIWIFGASDGRGLAGNTRYLASYVKKYCRDIRPVWLTSEPRVCAKVRELGIECHMKYSIRGFALAAKAKAFFITHHLFDLNPFVSGGAQIIQTWHGIPLKKIEFDTIDDGVYKSFLLAREPFGVLVRKSHTFRRGWLLATSSETARTLSSGFLAPPERVWITGYPRNDVLYSDEFPLLREELSLKAELEATRRMLPGVWVGLYAPTFRLHGRGAVERFFMDVSQVSRLEHMLEKANIVLYLKLHPMELERLKTLKQDSGLRLSRLRVFTAEDANPLLRHFDFLVTDYSSIYFDYLLLDRPLLFFPFDLDEYSRSRGLYYRYEEVTPGPKAYSFDEWLLALAHVRETAFSWSSFRQRLRDRFFLHQDGKSSARVVDRVRALLGL